MDTNSTAIALRVSRRAAKNITVIGVVSCLAVTGFAAAVGGGTTGAVVLVDRIHKADRLLLVPERTSNLTPPVVTTLSRPPIACEPAFSRLADPKRSHIFGRCIS
jgi:hypothetical protein